MKNLFAFLFILFATQISYAQTQQGIVKTRGRMVNGQLVSGKRLTGATITLNFGNPLVSGNQGAFLFNVPSGKNYSLVAAKKQGYTLADPEYTRRSFKYSSSNPFYVVLEDENQRLADINAATRKVRKTLTAQLEKREEEIEALKAQNKITEKEYQKRLKQLYEDQSNSEKLVKEMAERYASTDYDQLDEFNRKVQQYIEEGELQKADSMIRSKGDIGKRVEEYHRVLAANKKERAVLEQREMLLEKSKQVVVKTFEDLCQDLYRRRDIFAQKHMPDSVLYCLKLLADLDTTNVDATYQFAYSARERFQREVALKYTLMTIRNAEAQGNTRIMAMAENHLGNIYEDMNRLDESKEMYLRCLEHFDKLLSTYGGIYYRQLRTMPIFNLGIIYQNQGDIKKAEEYFLKSLSEHKELIRADYNSFVWDYVWTEDRVGRFYTGLKNFEEANKHLDIAFSIISDSIKFPHDIEDNISLYAKVIDHLAWLKYQVGDYPTCIIHYMSAAQLFEKLYKNDPDIYRLNLALVYFYTMISYGKMEDRTHYYEYLDKAMELYVQLYEINPDMYRKVLIDLRYKTTLRMLTNGNFDTAIEYAKATCCMDETSEQAKESLASCFNNLAYEYANRLDFDNAYESIEKAIAVMSSNANLFDSKGNFLLMQGKNNEALEMWKKVLELNPDFLDDYPDGTNLSNGLKKLGLIE